MGGLFSKSLDSFPPTGAAPAAGDRPAAAPSGTDGNAEGRTGRGGQGTQAGAGGWRAVKALGLDEPTLVQLENSLGGASLMKLMGRIADTIALGYGTVLTAATVLQATVKTEAWAATKTIHGHVLYVVD